MQRKGTPAPSRQPIRAVPEDAASWWLMRPS
jgi:hypothetical protein